MVLDGYSMVNLFTGQLLKRMNNMEFLYYMALMMIVFALFSIGTSIDKLIIKLTEIYNHSLKAKDNNK